MASVLNFAWVKEFVQKRLPDPEPGAQCVRIFRAVTGILVSAALLDTTSVAELSRFTSIHPKLIEAVASNMRNNKLWNASTYDYSEWLSTEGELKERMLLEHVDIAFGDTWVCDASTDESLKVFQMFADMEDAAGTLLF